MPADLIGRARRASGFAAVGHLLVSEHQQHLASQSSRHDQTVKHISILHEYWRTSDTARHGGNHIKGLASTRQCLRNCIEAHIALVPDKKLHPVAYACTLTRSNTCGPCDRYALRLSGCFQSSGGPSMASNIGPDSLRLEDTDVTLAIDYGTLRRDILQFQARAMLKNVQVEESCRGGLQGKEWQHQDQ
jgi:hypothetical protein